MDKKRERIVWFVLALSVFLLFCFALIVCVQFPLRKEKRADELAVINALLEKYHLSDSVCAEEVLTVGKDRSFRTLSRAVDRADDGDVIVLFNGIYTEAVHAAEKRITIIGESMENCILTHPNGDYFQPPLEMGSGMLANLTVYATAQEIRKDAIAKAYALHIDFDISKNSSFDVFDVKFVNDDYQVVGIGLRDHFSLRFKNCVFDCKGEQNAFYCHDDPIGVAATEQKLYVEDCVFQNNGIGSTILIQSQESEGSRVFCEWINNRVINSGSENLFSVHFWKSKIEGEQGWQNLSFWENSENSSGNSLNLLNER